MEKLEIGKKNILVVGDMMLDIYYEGKISRISPEAPVPVLLKTSERVILGGAANVVANLKEAGQNVFAMTVIGDDKNGNVLLQKLLKLKVNCLLVEKSVNRRTTTKMRIMGQNNQQVVRVDEEDTYPIEQFCSRVWRGELLKKKVLLKQ